MVEMTWLGHSSFQLVLEGGETWLIDPWVEGNPRYPAGHRVERLDGVLLTHGHFDHIHGMLELVGRFGCPVVGIHELCHWLGGKGVKDARGMNKGGTQRVGQLAVTMTHAVHSTSVVEEDGRLVAAGEAAGYVIALPDGRRMYFAGDTAVFSDMRLIHDLYKPELAFLPIGDLYTMDPLQAAAACRMLRPKRVIPMHYGTFPVLSGTPAELAALIADLPGTSVWELEPGAAVRW